LSIWYRQRTRWLSGHIQTLFVHAPPPRANVATIWRWFMCMLVIVGRLASGPTHGLTLLLVSQQMTQTDLGTGFELRGLVPFTGHFVMFLVLVQLAPSARFSHRIWLGLSHNVYWLMTLFPLLNATKRMALGQLSWLKSAHKPYEPQLKLGSKSSQPVEPRQGPIKIQLAKPDLSAPH
jgi:cellulose synthase/poly-beta-1,6-N-acetylglucosamine synthase-like glycosyltransferase